MLFRFDGPAVVVGERDVELVFAHEARLRWLKGFLKSPANFAECAD
jgi:hypothetical protein